MKKYPFLIIVFLIPTVFLSQTANIKKATKSYSKYDFNNVINNVGDKAVLSTDVTRKLADSYKMAGDYKNAEKSYQKIITQSDKTPADIYAYAQILKINGKYAQAAEQLNNYSTLSTNDSRVILYNSNKNYIEELLKNKEQFRIKNLEINSNEQEFGATYYKEEVVYTSSKHSLGLVYRVWTGNKLPYLDLYKAKASATNELSSSKKIRKFSNKFHDGPASYSKDGKITVFTSDNYESKSKDGIRKLQLFESKLNQAENWEEKVAFPFNNSEYSCGHPALSADGNTLYFSSDMPGGLGGVDIYKSVRAANGTWAKPENLGSKINTEGDEMFPFIHESGLFFFSSDGRPGLGGLDVFVTEIKSDNISKVMNVGVPINSSKDDFTMVLDAEMKKGYFASNRDGGKGNDDIYSYDLLKPFVFGKVIKGVAKDKDGAILTKVVVNLFDNNGNVLQTVTTSDNGAYSFNVDADKQFALNGVKEAYFDGKNTANTSGPADVIISDVVLEKDPGFTLFALITDYKSKSPLEGVSMKITDDKGGLVEFLTSSNGEYKSPIIGKKLGDNIKYTLELSKQGYVSKKLDFVKQLQKPGEQKVHESLDLTLGKVAVGGDLATMVDIKPIYFDVNKFDIRQDAAKELDKIVKIMNEYPNMVVELGSHTDCRASKTYNENLSSKRATASAAYIKKSITKPERIFGKGYGESKLKNACACEGAVKSTCTDAEHQENRRTEFIIVKLLN